MADLKSFLAENAIKAENKKYVASKRFVEGEDKTPIEWELQVISNEEINKIRKSCTKKEYNRKNGSYDVTTDDVRFNNEMVCASVVYPNLNDAELQDSYKVTSAQELILRMLTPGEYVDLVAAVSEVCGFQTDMSDKISAAKN